MHSHRSSVRPRLRLVLALAAALVTALCAFVTAPAQAQQVVGHDPRDAPFYDIATVKVQHGKRRARFVIHAHDRTPYRYDLKVDTPRGKPWKYVLVWSAYTPRKVWVLNRKQYQGAGARCTLRSAREPSTRDVAFSVPLRCLREPRRFRVKAKSWDDEAGYVDHTSWTRWARRG